VSRLVCHAEQHDLLELFKRERLRSSKVLLEERFEVHWWRILVDTCDSEPEIPFGTEIQARNTSSAMLSSFSFTDRQFGMWRSSVR
jgi:hypothetical protein